MRNAISASALLAVLAAVAATTGCQTRQGLYGADDFQRIGEVGGRPAYKAVGYRRYTDPDAVTLARQVVRAACPAGNPELIDGVTGSGRYIYFNQADWWWISFSCDDEIPLK
jgi:hypothetical protein